MILGCDGCQTGFKVLGRVDEFRVLELDARFARGYPCPTPGCSSLQTKDFMNVGTFIDIPVTAFYRAIHGMGFGETAGADPQVVEELFKTKKVLGINVRGVGDPRRSIIDSLTFEDGTTLYFANSNEGACIYLIEKGNLLYENAGVSAARAPSSGVPDRTQARHPASGAAASRGRVPDHAAHEGSDS